MQSPAVSLLALASLFLAVAAQNGAADFGDCTPTMDLQFGRAEFGRAADEGTFFPTDDVLVADTNQADAFNPGIIANFICNQLVNECGANEAAQADCADARALVEGLDARDQSTADAFNQALGF